MVKKGIENVIIISAIIPATVFFTFVVIGLLVYASAGFKSNEICSIIPFILGFIGYFGFWAILIFKDLQYLRITLFLLSLGIVSNVIFVCLYSDLIDTTFYRMFDSIITGYLFVFWINGVGIFYIFKLSKKLIDGKKGN